MDLGLEDRVAIVTGAGRGIGLAVAERLLEEGARVVRVSRGVPERTPEGMVHIQADVLAEATPTLLVDRALTAFGRLDVLVNSAGAARVREGYDRLSAAEWQGTWELVFLAQIRMTAAALPHLLAAGRVWSSTSRRGTDTCPFPVPRTIVRPKPR